MKIGMVSLGEPASVGRPDAPFIALAEALGGLAQVSLLSRRHTAEVPGWLAGASFEARLLSAGPASWLDESATLEYVGEFVRALDGEVRAGGYDVLHSHGWLAGLAANLVAPAHRVPVVHTVGLPRAADGQLGASWSGAERACLRRADHLLVTSVHEQQWLVRTGVPRRRVSVVPAGVAVPEPGTAGAGPVGVRARGCDEPARLVAFGPPARAVRMVRALPTLPCVELVVCAGPAEDEAAGLVELAGRLGVAERLRVERAPGARRRAELIRSADLVLCVAAPQPYVHVYPHEYLEAMALGVPVLAGEARAAEAVVDGVTGRHIVDLGPRGLTSLVRELLGSVTLRQQMGIAGQDRAASRYNWARIAAETLRVYQNLPDVVSRHYIR